MTLKTLGSLFDEARARGAARFGFVERDGSALPLGIEELDDVARSGAATLAALAPKGALVVLALLEPRDFLPAFWACVKAGVVPVPVPPPDVGSLERFEKLWDGWGRPVVVTSALIAQAASYELAGAMVDLRPSGERRHDVALPDRAPLADDVALVQPSSGTTGRPRGVLLSHANLIANVRQMSGRLRLTAADTVLSWMPLFHDMGLIATHLASLASDTRQLWMTPAAFFRQPALWLRVATSSKATILTGTNTSVRLLTRRLSDDDVVAADLSSVRRFHVGAEPISPRALRELERRLAPAHLAPDALGGCYGLAEACVGVALEGEPARFVSRRCSRRTLGVPGAPVEVSLTEEESVEVLEIGRPLDGVDVRVVDDDGEALQESHVGHVEVRGPNVTRGYLFDDDATTAARKPGGWWRTGDLGFLSANGALSVCGRVKDLLFASGRNLYADDVEAIAAEVPGVQRAVIAWAAASGGEEVHGLFLVLHDDAPAEATASRARDHVVQKTGLRIDVVRLIDGRDIPRTSSGKVQRARLGDRLRSTLLATATSALVEERSMTSGELPATAEEWRALVRGVWSDVLSLPSGGVGDDDLFSSLGGSSVAAFEVQGRLEEALRTRLDHDLLLRGATVREMASWLASRRLGSATTRTARRGASSATSEPIAVVGIACRLPLGADPQAFWAALVEGRDARRDAPRERWSASAEAGLPHTLGSWLDDPWAFDPDFFSLARDEARRLDPQQRIVLELAVEALETAGLGRRRRHGSSVGVFVGASSSPYLEASLLPWQRRDAYDALFATSAFRALPSESRRLLEEAAYQSAGDLTPHAATLVGNLPNMIAGRVAHTLDLRGPALAVDTACSSSLVAVHLACQSLRRGECDIALAGGVAVHLSPAVHRAFHAAGALSKAGACRPFSQTADGIVPGEGAALFVLEPLSRASAAGRHVLAVLRGSAVNNDGRSLGVMAPNPEGQRAVIEEAYRSAGVDVEDVSLLEAHGTGTTIGDPIEVRALSEALGARRRRALGSVKANLGHLMAASGAAGLMKVLLALQHRVLPPTLVHDDQNARLMLEARRLWLPREATVWSEPSPRTAAVSAFGFGGTNAHVVVSEAPKRSPEEPKDVSGPHLLLLSAPTARHAAAYADVLADSVAAEPMPPSELAAVLSQRTAHAVRDALIVDDGTPVPGALRALAEQRRGVGRAPVRERSGPLRLGLLFPGQGSQHVRQSDGLLARWPSLRRRVVELLEGAGARAAYDACWGDSLDPEKLQRTDIAQPLIVAFQCAVVERLRAGGLHVCAAVGHSVGELSALVAAGLLDVTRTLAWVQRRGEIMHTGLRGGEMVAVFAPVDDVRALVTDPAVGIAAVNGPQQVVVAGAAGAMRALQRTAEERGFLVRPLPVSHAFHSPLVDELLPILRGALPPLPAREALADVISTVHGRRIDARQVDHEYLVTHARRPVLFADAFGALAESDVDAFLEIGPGAALSRLGRAMLQEGDARPVLSLCRPAGAAIVDEDAADVRAAYETLATLFVAGADVDVAALEERRTPARRLPPIPWLHESLRLDAEPLMPATRHPSGLQRRVLVPVKVTAEIDSLPEGPALLVGAASPLRDALHAHLERAGRQTIVVDDGTQGLLRLAHARYALEPGAIDAARWLLEDHPTAVPLLLPSAPGRSPKDRLRLLAVWHAGLRALASRQPLLVVDDGGPAQGAALQAAGAALVTEGTEVRLARISTRRPENPSTLAERVLRSLASFPTAVIDEDGGVHLERLEDVIVPADDGGLLSAAKSYVILGGAGGVGSALARHFARHGAGRLVLVGRRPPSQVRAVVDAISLLGARTTYLAGDARSPEVLERVFAEASDDGRPLGGVVHSVGTAALASFASDPAGVGDVFEPKAAVGKALSAALHGRAYDFVALLSSVTTVDAALARGLVEYAAANGFLEGLADEERARGRPWTAVSFPAWRGLGLAAHATPPRSAAGAEVPFLEEDEATAAFDVALRTALLTGSARVVVSGAARFYAREPVETTAPELPAPADSNRGAARDLAAASRPHEPSGASPKVGADNGLESLLRDAIARATGQVSASVDPHASLVRMGLDSLAAVDVVKQLEEHLGRKLSLTLLFEHDSIAKVITHLRPEQDAIASPPPEAPTEKNGEDALDGVPLLPAQKTFFANQGFLPDLPCYVFLGVDLDGPLDASALERALEALHQRHPILRCAAVWRGTELVHATTDAAAPHLVRHDLRHLCDAQQDARVLELEHQLRNRRFDLESPPLYRVTLLRRAERRHVLLLAAHHLIVDAWSAHRLVDELLELHARDVGGDRTPLPALRSGFGDAVRALTGPTVDGEASARFWDETLRDAAPRLRLPFDGDPDDEPRGPCELHQVSLDEEETRALRESARRQGVSVFDAVLATYASCLHAWSGSEDVLIRVANARREVRLDDVEGIIGCFADSLPLRLAPASGPLGALAQRARAASIAAMKHPLTSSLALASHGPRSRGGPRGLTPAGLSFPSFRARERWGGLTARGLRGGSASGFTQLGLIAWETSSGLQLSWNFTQPLFRPSTIERLAREHIEALRRFVTEDTGGEAPVRRRKVALTPGGVVHQRIHIRAEQVPQRVAVVDGDRSLTYEELGARAGHLANALGAHGIGRGDRVAVLARPSAEGVVGVLGAMSSGAAYVPIDPEYPDARVALLAHHARVSALVTTSDQLSRVSREVLPSEARVIILLDDAPAPPSLRLPVTSWSEVQQLPVGATPSSRPEDLAYVMYTSGTTGAPKGVMVRHEAVSRFHDWVHDAFEVSHDDRFLQTSALSFGGSIRQIFSPLLAGASVHPVRREVLRDPSALLRFLDEDAISIWNSVPTLWRHLLDAIEDLAKSGAAPALTHLRWVLIGGEVVPADLPRRWMQRFGRRHRIANLYGSTETVVNATWWELTAPPSPQERHVPIGRARSGSEVLLLDDNGGVCVTGDVGELHVGGPSLADGYLHEPELTAAAFVRLPDGRRVYRTGDVARAGADGALTYIGRRDSMVKVRGNRVELGEIEAVLREDEHVRQAGVVVWNVRDHQRLVALLEPHSPDHHIDTLALRRRIAAALPDYMMPHRFDVLPALPLTPAGKVDRRGLLHHLEKQAEDGVTPLAVAAPLEETVMDAFRAALDVDVVRSDDDFFLLGGDSILALDVVRRLRDRGVAVPQPMLLYAERTPRRIALALAAAEPSTALPRITSSISNLSDQSLPGLPLLPSQTGFLLSEAMADGRAPVWAAALPVDGRIEEDAFRRALTALTERHEMLRVTFPDVGGTRRQVVGPAQCPPFAGVDMARAAFRREEAELDERLHALAAMPFDSRQGPLWRVQLLRAGPRRAFLLVAAHHAIVDAWSLGVLGRDLAELYAADVEARVPALPSLRSDTAAIVESIPSPGSVASLSWWRARYARAWPSLAPVTRDGAVSGHSTLLLPRALSRALDGFQAASGHGVSLALFTAYARVLARRARVADVVIGVAQAGRDLPLDDVGDLVGCFARGLPVRVTLSGSGAFGEDLDRCAEAFTDHLARADVSPGRLARELPRPAQSPFPPGAECFLSVVDLRRLARASNETLSLDIEAARTSFAAEASGSRLFLGVRLGERCRLTVYADTPDSDRSALLEELKGELERGLLLDGAMARRRASSSPAIDVDSAIVGYLPAPARLAGLLRDGGQLSREDLRLALFPDGAPRLVETTTVSLGRSATVLLPLFADELSEAVSSLSGLIAGGVAVAQRAGARVVSLAGMLPSLTGYGIHVEKALAVSDAAGDGTATGGAARLTSGHAATAVAVAMTTLAALEARQVSLGHLHLGVLGFGSIGQTALRLLLQVAPRPARVTVLDVRSRLQLLRRPFDDVTRGSDVPASLVEAGDASLRDIDVLVCATSGGGVTVDALRSGAILVDDSFPPALDVEAALARVAAGTLFAVDGGRLALEGARELHVGALVPMLPVDIGMGPGMPGCRVEAVVLAARPDLPATSGLVSAEAALVWWHALQDIGIGPAPFALHGRRLPGVSNVASTLTKVQK